MTDKIRISLFILLSVLSIGVYAKGEEKPEIKIIPSIEKSGYEGEVFTYEVRLRSTSPDISNVRVMKEPLFPAGGKKKGGVVRNGRPEKTVEKGKTYYTWVISRIFFIPDKEGKMQIGEGKYVVFIPHEKVVYHDFWGSRRTVEYEEVAVDSKSVGFKVNSLPDSKGRKEFAGCVGDFKVEGWFPPGKITPGNEAYAIFTISGFGDLSNLKIPNIYKIFDKGCQLKEVEQNEEQSQRDGKLYSEVTLTCRFVPEEEDFRINPLAFTFFNPATGRYYDAESDALHWTGHPTEKKTETQRDAIAI